MAIKGRELTETAGCRLVGPTQRTPTGFPYADGGVGTPTGANADGETPTAAVGAVGVPLHRCESCLRQRRPAVGVLSLSCSDAMRCLYHFHTRINIGTVIVSSCINGTHVKH